MEEGKKRIARKVEQKLEEGEGKARVGGGRRMNERKQSKEKRGGGVLGGEERDTRERKASATGRGEN